MNCLKVFVETFVFCHFTSMQAEALLCDENLALLKEIEGDGQCFFKWFLALTEIFHGTGECNALMSQIAIWAQFCGYEADISDNVIIEIPANGAAESAPTIALQAHMDMVVMGEAAPMKVEIEEIDGKQVIRAPKSTLGADNGFGVALMLEVMEKSKEFTHGPLLLIFTSDEEAGLVGVGKLPKSPELKFDYLVNMDSLCGDKVYVGCPGSRIIDVDIPVTFGPVSSDDYEFLKISLKGLHGGHSGKFINDGYANAIKWAARILIALSERQIQYRIVSMECGGVTNAIPASFLIIIAVPKDKKDDAIDLVNHNHTTQVLEYFRVERTDFFTEYCEMDTAEAASVDDTKRIVDLLMAAPHGVLRMSPQFPGTVEASVNFATCNIKSGNCRLEFRPRSSRDSQMVLFVQTLTSLLRLYNKDYNLMTRQSYPAWEPRLKSKLANRVKQIHDRLHGGDIQLGLLHIGVEPAVFHQLGYGNAEMVAAGPSVHLAHAVGEHMEIEESLKWRATIMTLLTELAQ